MIPIPRTRWRRTTGVSHADPARRQLPGCPSHRASVARTAGRHPHRSDLEMPVSALYMPRITSALLRDPSFPIADRVSFRVSSLLIAADGCVMMPPYAGATGVPGYHECVGAAAAATAQRPRQGRRDPRVTASAGDTAAPARRAAGPAQPGRPGLAGRPATPPSEPSLHGIRLLVKHETILRWHRSLLARHHAAASRLGRRGPAGNRPLDPLACAAPGPGNPSWGYCSSLFSALAFLAALGLMQRNSCQPRRVRPGDTSGPPDHDNYPDRGRSERAEGAIRMAATSHFNRRRRCDGQGAD